MSYQVFLCKKYSCVLKSSDENICIWVDIDKLSDENLLPNIEKIVEMGLELLK